MEILYMWIKQYNSSIKGQGFNFGGEYLFDFEDKVLKCEKNENFIKDFYGENIRNITAIVGENGTGKTSILKCIIRNLTKNLANIQTEGIFVIKEGENVKIYVHKNLPFNKESSNNFLRKGLSVSALNFNIEEFETENYVYGKSNIKNLDLRTSYIYYSNIYENNRIFKRNYAYEDLTPGGLIEKYGSKPYYIATELYNLNEIKNQIKFVTDFKEKEIVAFYTSNKVKVSLVDLERYDYIFAKLKYKEDVIKNITSKSASKRDSFKSRFDIILSLLLEIELSFDKGQIKSKEDIYDYRKSLVKLLSDKNTKDSTYIININDLAENVRRIVNSRSLKNNSIIFDINDEAQRSELDQLLDLIIRLEFNEKIFEFSWENLSTGQQAFLNIFSRFYSIKETRENVVILIDEGETYLHPKWQREFIMNLISVIPELLKEKSITDKINIQIIITSNTPFLISDLPKENIIFLENKNGYCNVLKSAELEQTFGSNIHTLLRNSFFMDNTIGKFAYRKINEVIDWLKRVEKQKNNNCYKTNEEDENRIKCIIDNVGEPLIKNKLEKMYFNNFLEILNKENQIIEYKKYILNLQNQIKNRVILDKEELKKLMEQLNNTSKQINNLIDSTGEQND
jgi:predicted ATP-dependent endonuclease of OLD family